MNNTKNPYNNNPGLVSETTTCRIPDRIPDINRQMSELESSIEHLSKASLELTEKLKPIRSNLEIKPAKNCVEEPKAMTDLGNKICSMKHAIYLIITQLEECHNTVEL